MFLPALRQDESRVWCWVKVDDLWNLVSRRRRYNKKTPRSLWESLWKLDSVKNYEIGNVFWHVCETSFWKVEPQIRFSYVGKDKSQVISCSQISVTSLKPFLAPVLEHLVLECMVNIPYARWKSCSTMCFELGAVKQKTPEAGVLLQDTMSPVFSQSLNKAMCDPRVMVLTK